MRVPKTHRRRPRRNICTVCLRASDRVAPGRYRPGAPTDPDVRTLAHPVPRPTDSPSTGGPRSYLIDLRGHGDRASMCSPWFPRSGLPADASLSSTGSSEASSPASRVLSKRYDFLPPIPPRFVSFAWRYLGVTRWFRSSADECTAEAWSWSPGSSRRDLAEETTGPPKVPGESRLSVCTCSNPTPAGLLAPDQYGAAAWPLVEQQQRLPRKVFRRSIAWLSDSLSTLRSAGYPNPTQDSLPVAGQALPDGLSTRKIPLKGFRSASYISSSSPKLLWHNVHDRRKKLHQPGAHIRAWPRPFWPSQKTFRCRQCLPVAKASSRSGPGLSDELVSRIKVSNTHERCSSRDATRCR